MHVHGMYTHRWTPPVFHTIGGVQRMYQRMHKEFVHELNHARSGGHPHQPEEDAKHGSVQARAHTEGSTVATDASPQP